MRFTGGTLVENANLGKEGLVSVENLVHGHLGSHVLPWTTALALILQWRGAIGERFTIRVDVFKSESPESPLFFRNEPISMTKAEQTGVFEIKVEFKEPGLYVFRASTADDETNVIAELADGA